MTISVTTALGLDDEPGELAGYGPISAAHGRELIATAELRKVSLDARTGQVLHVDDQILRPTPSRSGRNQPLPEHVRQALLSMIDTPSMQPTEAEPQYRPSTSLTRTVQTRTPRCDLPCCSTPATRCDLDHTRAWPRGSTSADNLAPRSRRHHRAKQAGWTPCPLPDGSTQWNAPSGRTYVTPPAQ